MDKDEQQRWNDAAELRDQTREHIRDLDAQLAAAHEENRRLTDLLKNQNMTIAMALQNVQHGKPELARKRLVSWVERHPEQYSPLRDKALVAPSEPAPTTSERSYGTIPVGQPATATVPGCSCGCGCTVGCGCHDDVRCEGCTGHHPRAGEDAVSAGARRPLRGQRKILARLAKGPAYVDEEPLNGWNTKALARRGLIERHREGEFPEWRFFWRITDAGRAALAEARERRTL